MPCTLFQSILCYFLTKINHIFCFWSAYALYVKWFLKTFSSMPSALRGTWYDLVRSHPVVRGSNYRPVTIRDRRLSSRRYLPSVVKWEVFVLINVHYFCDIKFASLTSNSLPSSRLRFLLTTPHSLRAASSSSLETGARKKLSAYCRSWPTWWI